MSHSVQRSHPDKINAGVKAKSIKVFGFRKSRKLIKRCQAQLSAKTKKTAALGGQMLVVDDYRVANSSTKQGRQKNNHQTARIARFWNWGK